MGSDEALSMSEALHAGTHMSVVIEAIYSVPATSPVQATETPR